MTEPRKAKDLSALKARLARKAEGPESGGSDTAPVGDAGADHDADIHHDSDEPSHAARAPARAPAAATEGAPFSGGASFDPDQGVFSGGDVGEIKGRKSTGLIALAAAAGVAFGAAVGWIGHTSSAKSAQVGAAKKKGTEMLEEVARVKDSRARVSLGLEDIRKAIAADPAKGSEQLTTLLTENFSDFPKAQKLFGWQLAALNPKSIQHVFSLYEEAHGLLMDLGRLAGFVNANAALLAEGMNGPSQFAVQLGADGATLVEAVAPICNLEEKTPCEPEKAKDALGYSIREAPGGPESVVAKEQVMLLLPSGPMYQIAIGDKAERHTVSLYGMQLQQIAARLEAMNLLEKNAIAALEVYTGSPTVDENSAQPDPGP